MFVLDASVVASWCFPDEFAPNAEAALRKAKAAGGPEEFERLFRRALELVR